LETTTTMGLVREAAREPAEGESGQLVPKVNAGD
jgi:hypothetical protein